MCRTLYIDVQKPNKIDPLLSITVELLSQHIMASPSQILAKQTPIGIKTLKIKACVSKQFPGTISIDLAKNGGNEAIIIITVPAHNFDDDTDKFRLACVSHSLSLTAYVGEGGGNSFGKVIVPEKFLTYERTHVFAGHALLN